MECIFFDFLHTVLYRCPPSCASLLPSAAGVLVASQVDRHENLVQVASFSQVFVGRNNQVTNFNIWEENYSTA